ncbi:hypothetical protein SNEBB_010174 [Seison nebaliae]|nr:hypothetical protein SNEBB_010174 [Seison nebaliae]
MIDQCNLLPYFPDTSELSGQFLIDMKPLEPTGKDKTVRNSRNNYHKNLRFNNSKSFSKNYRGKRNLLMMTSEDGDPMDHYHNIEIRRKPIHNDKHNPTWNRNKKDFLKKTKEINTSQSSSPTSKESRDTKMFNDPINNFEVLTNDRTGADSDSGVEHDIKNVHVSGNERRIRIDTNSSLSSSSSDLTIPINKQFPKQVHLSPTNLLAEQPMIIDEMTKDLSFNSLFPRILTTDDDRLFDDLSPDILFPENVISDTLISDSPISDTLVSEIGYNNDSVEEIENRTIFRRRLNLFDVFSDDVSDEEMNENSDDDTTESASLTTEESSLITGKDNEKISSPTNISTNKTNLFQNSMSFQQFVKNLDSDNLVNQKPIKQKESEQKPTHNSSIPTVPLLLNLEENVERLKKTLNQQQPRRKYKRPKI